MRDAADVIETRAPVEVDDNAVSEGGLEAGDREAHCACGPAAGEGEMMT